MSVRPLNLPIYAGLAGVLGFIILSVVSLRHDYDVAQERAFAEVKNISRLMELHTEAKIRTIDLVLQDIQGHLKSVDLQSSQPPDPARTTDIHQLLLGKGSALPEVHGLHVINAEGQFIYSSLDSIPPISMEDRWHFTVQRDQPDKGLAISEPLLGRTTGHWTVVITRRLNFPDGSFAGVVAATFLPESYESFYQTLSLGTHGSVAIRDDKARLLARFPPSPDQIGVFNPNHPALPYLARKEKEIFYYSTSVVDGIYRVHSIRRVNDSPLYVFAGLAPEDYMAGWRKNLYYYSAGALLLALVVTLLIVLARRGELKRNQAETALRQNEERYRLLLEQSPIGVFHYGNDLHLTYTNERFASILSSTVARILNLDLANLRDSAVLPALKAALNGTTGIYEGPYQATTSGATIWVSMRTGPLLDDKEQIIGGIGIVEDISAREKAAAELRLSERRFRTMADFTYDWEYWQAPDGGIIYMTPSCIRITGYTQAEFMAHPHLLHEIIHPEDLPTFDDHLEHQVFHHDGIVDFRIQRRDGGLCWIAHGCRAVRSPEGEYLGRRVSNRDITERKLLEDQLTRFNNELEQRVQEEVAHNREKDQLLIQQSRLAAMGEMVHNIAHQWRQPLNALSIIIANIKDDYDYRELTEDRLQEAVQHSRRLLEKMSMTIDDFRNFFRPDREESIFDPAREVDEALFILEASLRNNHIQVDCQMNRGLQVSGFPNQFAQALLNILVNAKEAIRDRHMDTGTITINLTARDGKAILGIADNAGGIDAAILPKVFDPYFTTKEQGSGIGLYMTQMIIQRNMKGSIKAENIDGGARLTIELPLQGENNEPGKP